MKAYQQTIQCRDEFIKAWVGKVPEEITQLFSAIVGKAEKENVFDINMTTVHGNSLVHLIVSTNQDQTKALDILLAKGADINLVAGNKAPLHLAIDEFLMNNDRYNFVNFLILKGADINKSDETGKTPLHHVAMLIDYSAKNNIRNLLLLLLQNGAVVAKQDDDGFNSYNCAEERKEEHPGCFEIKEVKECMSILKEYFEKEKELATQCAIKFENKFNGIWKNIKKPYSFVLTKIVKRAKEEGIFDVNWDGNGPGITLLHFAATLQELDVIQLLLDYGANVNIQTKKSNHSYAKTGYTPLHCVCDPHAIGFKIWYPKNISKEARDCILLLLLHDAKFDIPDKEGDTVLNIAMNNREKDEGALYNLLIEGANPYEKSKQVALKTGVYQVPTLFEISFFKTKKTFSNTEIGKKKDQIPADIYTRLIS